MKSAFLLSILLLPIITIQAGPFQPSYTYQVGGLGNTLTFYASSNSTNGSKTYQIFRNNTLNATGTWITDMPISINIDNLTIGNYNYTMIAKVGSVKVTQETIIVHVINLSGPGQYIITVIIAVIVVVLALIGLKKVSNRKRNKFSI